MSSAIRRVNEAALRKRSALVSACGCVPSEAGFDGHVSDLDRLPPLRRSVPTGIVRKSLPGALAVRDLPKVLEEQYMPFTATVQTAGTTPSHNASGSVDSVFSSRTLISLPG